MTKRAAAALLAGLILLISAAAAQADRRVALVIGNSAYQNAPALPDPVPDATAMAAMFQKAGFDVVTARYDAGNAAFRRAVREFDDAAAGSDIAAVYYSGHGIAIHGVNYLVPVDARLASDWDADDELVALERFVEPVGQARQLGVIILDANRDNPFTRTMKQRRPDSAQQSAANVAPVEPGRMNTLIAYAAKAGSLSVDGTGDRSPFTAALLHHMFVPGLDIRFAFGRIRDEVLKATNNRQEPFVYGSLGGGTIALVGSPDRTSDAAQSPDQVKTDYALVERIGTEAAYKTFLAQHPTGCYARLALRHVAAMEAAKLKGPSENVATDEAGVATGCEP